MLFAAAGSLRPAYEAVDWSQTAVGPVDGWSPTLRTAVDLALSTPFPVTLLWGPELVLIYNAAYVPLISDKHPAALGRRAQDVFPEAWDTIGPLLEDALAGRAIWVEDASVPLFRNGRLEESYFTFAYSPVRRRDGVPEGVLDIATETTRQVIDRRRLLLLGRLRELLTGLEHVDDVVARALPLLRSNVDDLPAVDVLSESAPGGDVRLALGDGRVLAVQVSEHQAFDEQYRGFLELLASTLAQALVRIGVREAERRVATTERHMSETLQRSLLTRPLQRDDLTVAVRYLPAAEQAQVGGDWYDSFMLPGGRLALVVGDVAGHDRLAAAEMAQTRNLLRGVALTLDGSPAEVLAGLDRAMDGLGVNVVATAVLAQIDPADRRLCWSNAGHPPPVLIGAGGHARLLDTAPNVLLGVALGGRDDHALQLDPGATLVLYTDGLVERRGESVQAGLDWLAGFLRDTQALTPDQLCDHIVAQLGPSVEDDVALLVLRVAA